MNVREIFQVRPEVDGVAHDWEGKPIALIGIVKGGPHIQRMCCGDPRWFWSGVLRIEYLPDEPEDFPDISYNGESLRLRPAKWNDAR